MPDVSVVIPVAPYHAGHLRAALDSATAQTTPVDVIVVRDDAGRGAGHARNVGLAAVKTPLVVFLDADDTLAPTFVERTLAAWSAWGGTRYVYTDWMQGDERKAAPECAWINRTFHCVTTLLPTAWVRAIGGFNETLPGGEDTELYLRLVTSGYCGKRLAEPLFHYGKDGQRSKAFVHGPDYARVTRQWTEKFGGRMMSCCGEITTSPDEAMGERQPGDVLAKAIWGGNRSVRGVMTGRTYPRTGNGKLAWVDPADVDAAPHLWRREEPLPVPPSDRAAEPPRVAYLTTAPVLNGVAEIGQAMWTPRPALVAVDPAPVAPDVATARSLYARAVNPTGERAETTTAEPAKAPRRAAAKSTKRAPRKPRGKPTRPAAK